MKNAYFYLKLFLIIALLVPFPPIIPFVSPQARTVGHPVTAIGSINPTLSTHAKTHDHIPTFSQGILHSASHQNFEMVFTSIWITTDPSDKTVMQSRSIRSPPLIFS